MILCKLTELSPTPAQAAKPLDTEGQFSPEPLAHEAVDIKVKTGVEDNEDMVEVGHTEPEARDGMPPSLVTDRHSEIFGVIEIVLHSLGPTFFH